MLAEVSSGYFFLSPAACVLIKHQMPQLKLKLVCYMGNFARKSLQFLNMSEMAKKFLIFFCSGFSGNNRGLC